MRKQYEQFTAAEGYAIGFHIGDEVYCAMLDRIPRRYTKVQKECSRIGGYGLYINVKNKKFKNELMKKAFLIGTLADIEPTPEYNRGVMFERLVYTAFGQEPRAKDSVRSISRSGRRLQSGTSGRASESRTWGTFLFFRRVSIKTFRATRKSHALNFP